MLFFSWLELPKLFCQIEQRTLGWSLSGVALMPWNILNVHALAALCTATASSRDLFVPSATLPQLCTDARGDWNACWRGGEAAVTSSQGCSLHWPPPAHKRFSRQVSSWQSPLFSPITSWFPLAVAVFIGPLAGPANANCRSESGSMPQLSAKLVLV